MQLLKTKFYIPDYQQAKMVTRAGFINPDMGISGKKLVLVSAPAGFGKTTCLTELLTTWDLVQNTSWLSLDKEDNLLIRFWSYVTGAIRITAPDIGLPALDLLGSAQPTDIESILISLINETGDYDGKLILVLDDYHVITDKSIHDSLDFFIDHLPPNLLLVLAGREDPPLHLSRLRVSGQLLEIRERSLRFTSQETRKYVNDISGLDLNDEEIESLTAKTEGWIAGIKLALLSLTESPDRNKFLRDFTGSNRFILDYLVEEVLKGLPEHIHHFMLDISVLDRFSDSLCTSVTGIKDSTSCLTYMDRNKLFLISLDHKRKWFRYHHLFRDFLRKHLVEKKKEYITNLHLKAYEWFRENGTWQEAFSHAVRANRPDLAGELLSGLSHDIFRECGGITLKPLLESLPPDIVLKYPELCAYMAWIDVIHGKFESVALLDQIQINNLSEKSAGLIQGFQADIRGYLAFYRDGDFDLARDLFRQALELIPEKHDGVRNVTVFALGIIHRFRGEFEAARKQYSIKIEKDRYMSVLHVVNRVDLEMECGRLNTAMEIVELCLKTGLERFGKSLPPVYGVAYVYQASILREWDDLDKAEHLCKTGIQLSENLNYIELIMVNHMEMAKIYAAASRFSEADLEIKKAIHIAQESSPWSAGMMLALKARFDLKNKKIAAVQKWAESFEKQMDIDRIPFQQSIEYLTYIRFCIETGKPGKAVRLLNRMIEEDKPENRNGRLLECLILKSKALHLDGRTKSAMESLKQSFLISGEQGYVRIYRDEYPAMKDLLERANQAKILPEHLKTCVDYESPDPESTEKTSSAIINDFKETMNERELSILTEMKYGKSNREIADKLFLSVNTVRWYASRLFAKLDVKRRGEAAAKAIQLKLIH